MPRAMVLYGELKFFIHCIGGTSRMDIILSEAIRIAKLAGTKIKELRERKQYSESVKDGYELVTTADLASNDVIKAEIIKIFSSHEILSEEDN
jgi:myo-inositol-1(or 4)-monophosphatase